MDNDPIIYEELPVDQLERFVRRNAARRTIFVCMRTDLGVGDEHVLPCVDSVKVTYKTALEYAESIAGQGSRWAERKGRDMPTRRVGKSNGCLFI